MFGVIGVMQTAAWIQPTGAVAARMVFVDSTSDCESPDGSSPRKAFRTIQQACDVVDAGDTVVIAPGVYFEHVRLTRTGTPEKPIVIRADQVARGRVTITGANRLIREGAVRWELVDSELGLYALFYPTVQQRPARVLYSGTDLPPYPTLDELKRFSFNDPPGYPGAAHGYAWDNQRRALYVRLHASRRYGDTDPNRHVMAVAPATGSGFAGLGFEEASHFNLGIYSGHDQPTASHVVLDGLTFETPGIAGVFVASAGNVTVRNCWCHGCRTMVSGRRFFNDRPDHTATTNSVTVENCEFTQHPAFADMMEVIERSRTSLGSAPSVHPLPPIYWWHRKGAPDGSLGGPGATYEVGIASAVGRGWVFRKNFIHDAFEGFSTWALSTSRDTLIERNRFERLVDNAVEAENHATDLIVRYNTIIDTFEPFSWQPLSGTPWPGPVAIHHNVILTSPDIRALWRDASSLSGVGWFPSIFKIGAARENWDLRSKPWMKEAPTDVVAAPSPGFRAWHNTVFAPGHRLVGRVGEAVRHENFEFRNNLFVVDDFDGGDEAFRSAGIKYAGNVVMLMSPRDDVGATFAAGQGGRVLSRLNGAGLKDPDSGDVSLTPNSLAIGATTPLVGYENSGSDAGALRRSESVPPMSAGPQVDR